jgi:serine/threonine protein kinase
MTVPAALKPSSELDWQREAYMHRECASCPFVLHMLAAKRCRSGDLLLLLEFADKGSLTDVLAAQAAVQLETRPYSFMPSAAAGLPESVIKFYSGCILLALEWLHAKRILHR